MNGEETPVEATFDDDENNANKISEERKKERRWMYKREFERSLRALEMISLAGSSGRVTHALYIRLIGIVFYSLSAISLTAS